MRLPRFFKKSSPKNLSSKLPAISYGAPVTLKANGLVYLGKITSITNVDFTVTLDIYERSQVLKRNDMVSVLYLFNKEVYEFQTYIKTVRREKTYSVILQYSDNIKKIERREYPRAAIEIALFYAPYDDIKKVVTWDKIKRTKTVDLSAGGVKFIVHEPYSRGIKFCLIFDIGTRSEIFFAEVVRCEKTPLYFMIATKFFDITKNEQSYLAEYVNAIIAHDKHNSLNMEEQDGMQFK